jgi:hypothetical protein
MQVPKNIEKHWNDNSNWTMAKSMHQEVIRATRVAMGAACYAAFSFDEISTVDNQIDNQS